MAAGCIFDRTNCLPFLKTIFDPATRAEVIGRIQVLSPSATAQWGTMNVSQMMKHCSIFEDMMLGKTKYRRALLGYLFGRLALRGAGNDAPLKQSTPTLSAMKIKDTPDFAVQKKEWIALIEEYGQHSAQSLAHPFFGKITRDQMGIIAYKHSDHHLRQFNA